MNKFKQCQKLDIEKIISINGTQVAHYPFHHEDILSIFSLIVLR